MNEWDTAYVKLLNGSLGIGHRPRLKKLKDYKHIGVTHIWTLLSEKEGALDIKRATHKSGLEWVWLPLSNGKPPEEEVNTVISHCFANTKELLAEGAKIYLHCSAGIHRTGMISYAFLRFLGYSDSESFGKLNEMRALTSSGVGMERLEWGNVNYG
ncbi:tyrosine-protein phosphatase [Alteromonas ponticola]|uniref:Tyrosine-protein phosphatase n=1 Tax=Alteromonas aquimaris TaxID=2998417 RepID=A0ABT3P870_9ALTE|nr:tyrosine-protein phosphatase [Alteromonas aquimaris]MCW8108970.1 tyrosine-protein phosphatase [Alteromonas aquimaris]